METTLRGDSNGDGNINIADPIFSLAYLFNQGSIPQWHGGWPMPTAISGSTWPMLCTCSTTSMDWGLHLRLPSPIVAMTPAPRCSAAPVTSHVPEQDRTLNGLHGDLRCNIHYFSIWKMLCFQLLKGPDRRCGQTLFLKRTEYQVKAQSILFRLSSDELRSP